MRNKSKRRLQHEMRVRMFALEKENEDLRRERDFFRQQTDFYRMRWVSEAPRYIVDGEHVEHLRAFVEVPQFPTTATGTKESMHWVKERVLSLLEREIRRKDLVYITPCGVNVFEGNMFVAKPVQTCAQTTAEFYRKHIYGEFSGDNLPVSERIEKGE